MRIRRTSLTWKLLIPLFLALCPGWISRSASCDVDAAVPRPLPRAVIGSTNRSLFISHALQVRGGSDEESDEGDEEGEAIESSTVMDTVLDLSKRVVILFGRATLETIKAASRALQAAFEGSVVEEDESLLVKISRMLQRMWSAAINPGRDDGDDDAEKVKEPTSTPKPKAKRDAAALDHGSTDVGDYLAKSYGIKPTRDELDDKTPVLGGTLSDVLQDARSKARLLVVFIPASKPGKGKKGTLDKRTPDQSALESFLSKEVSKIAEKRALKKGETGSFVLWSSKAGSPESVNAIKRLKAQPTNNKGQTRPILLVAYAAPVVDKRGVPRLLPILLAQHHCSPPPSPEMMAAWLNALRKRHAKQYGNMQTELREAQYFKDRKAGYKDSVKSDIVRKEQEKKAEEARKAQVKAEQERLEALEQRREQLRSSLPAEPSKDEAGAKTIALRLADGRSAQRRFTSDEKLSTVFDWVDVTFELERETVVLTTMNGSKSFSWDDTAQSLSESGLGRMSGLRVSQKAPEEEEATAAADGSEA